MLTILEKVKREHLLFLKILIGLRKNNPDKRDVYQDVIVAEAGLEHATSRL